MKIVQTFWHGNNSLLDNSFGWMNPQYHLMSWALSCLFFKTTIKISFYIPIPMDMKSLPNN